MARKWGVVKLAIAGAVLIVACVLAYYALLYLVRPHPAAVNYPVPSDLPPGAIVEQGGYIVVPYDPSINASPGGLTAISGYDANLTPEQAAAASSGDTQEVSFFQLPLWIQLYVLPGMLLGLILSFIGAALVIRRTRNSNNRNKREVFTYITDNPGCTAPELARDEHMNIGTVRYHIQRLQDESRVVIRKIGKYTRIFVNSHTYDDREKLIASHLRSDSSRQILGALMESPGITNQRISERLGMEKSLVYRYMQKLLDDGIITFEWEGKNKLYYVDQSAKEPIIKLMPRNYQCPGLMKDPKV